jgi:nitroreductase
MRAAAFAGQAPSLHNSQPWRWLIDEDVLHLRLEPARVLATSDPDAQLDRIATIRDIRRSIFELRAPVGTSLRTELRETVGAVTEALGFRPVLDTSGPVDSAIPDDIVPELLAVLREALANAARHAGSGDGPRRCRQHERARHDLGGTFAVGPGADGRGTLVTWRVPLAG